MPEELGGVLAILGGVFLFVLFVVVSRPTTKKKRKEDGDEEK